MELQRGRVHGEKLIEMKIQNDNIKCTPKKRGRMKKESHGRVPEKKERRGWIKTPRWLV